MHQNRSLLIYQPRVYLPGLPPSAPPQPTNLSFCPSPNHIRNQNGEVFFFFGSELLAPPSRLFFINRLSLNFPTTPLFFPTHLPTHLAS